LLPGRAPKGTFMRGTADTRLSERGTVLIGAGPLNSAKRIRPGGRKRAAKRDGAGQPKPGAISRTFLQKKTGGRPALGGRAGPLVSVRKIKKSGISPAGFN